MRGWKVWECGWGRSEGDVGGDDRHPGYRAPGSDAGTVGVGAGGDAVDEVVVVHTAGRRDERIVAAVADLDRAFAEEPRLARYRYRRVLLEGDGGPLEDIAIEADVMGGILGIIGLEQTWRWIMPRQMLEVRLEAVPLLFLAGVTPHGEPELQLVPLGALHFGLQARIDEWLEFGGDSAKAG